MISEDELKDMLADLESFRVERTVSTTNSDKFCQAVCAFANDMAGARLPGFLLIGATDEGELAGIAVTDQLLQNLAGMASDGNILPPPALMPYRLRLEGGEIAVVEVTPSDLPPVRYKGQAWIRRGPRKGIANASEESILVERRTATARTFDSQPCVGASLSDLSLDVFTNTYRPMAVDAETIAENNRPVELQLASLRFFDLARNHPTNAGVILFGKDVLGWLPNAYAQYVRFDGISQDAPIATEKRFHGDLHSMLRDLTGFVKLIVDSRPVRETELRETTVSTYPEAAIREFLLNAVAHRSYEAPQPIRFYQYSDRIEIQNPGPLYGVARRENFPSQTSYRNPVLAEALKTLGFINRFGRGVERAQAALARNGSPPADFTFGDLHFGVTIRSRPE